MKQLLLIFCLACASTSFGQLKDLPYVPTASEQHGEFMPVSGVDVAEYLGANLHYPDSAQAHKIQGKVIVRFRVSEMGFVEDCNITKSVGYGCDEEAVRVIMAMPRWKPGIVDGKTVPVYYSLPISFKL